MNTQEMMKTKAPAGYWFVNIAHIDQPQNWVIQPIQPILEDESKIFGYDKTEFLAKQYK